MYGYSWEKIHVGHHYLTMDNDHMSRITLEPRINRFNYAAR